MMHNYKKIIFLLSCICVIPFLSCNSSKYNLNKETEFSNFKYAYIESVSNPPNEQEKKALGILAGLLEKRGLQVLSKEDFRIISTDKSEESLITVIKFFYEVKSQKIDNKPGYKYSIPTVTINMYNVEGGEIYSGKSAYNGFATEDNMITLSVEEAFKGVEQKLKAGKQGIKAKPE